MGFDGLTCFVGFEYLICGHSRSREDISALSFFGLIPLFLLTSGGLLVFAAYLSLSVFFVRFTYVFFPLVISYPFFVFWLYILHPQP